MKIFSATQIKDWDQYTISHKAISSFQLMEKAALGCFKWLMRKNMAADHFVIFCGKGNNGGDGLAIARLLFENNCKVAVYITGVGKSGTADFEANLKKLYALDIKIHSIHSIDDFPFIHNNDIVIDALFGTGLNKPLKDVFANLVNYINQTDGLVISIDMPSGLYADKSSRGNMIIKANYTLSFQQYKLAFLLPENELYCGDVQLVKIGLHKGFVKKERAAFELINKNQVRKIFKQRSVFSHKGAYGHAALFCGSLGMMGAAVLCAKACLRSGVGKLTSYVPRSGNDIIQMAVPEAMSCITGEDFIIAAYGIEKFNVVGVGPGIGVYDEHKDLLRDLFKKVNRPMLIDADALNILAKHKSLLKLIPAYSIITPHPKEFERLFGGSANDFERLKLAMTMSKTLNIYIVLKGHYSFISTPGGIGYFNPTGNAGMATAGSGDVLSGCITALLAQGYDALEAAVLGVYLHGLAGDLAANEMSAEAMIAGDIINFMGAAFKQVKSYKKT